VKLGDIPAYTVGDSTTYSVNCAPANSPIYWSSTKNGLPTGEDHVYYGQNTDANGYWSGAGSPWTADYLGHWMKFAQVGASSVSVSFDVTPKITVDSFVDSLNNNAYPTATVGQSTTYTITGAPPNTPIYWSSTRNNQPTGEDHAYYGQNTDANGNWSATAGAPWSSALVGAWTKTASFGDPANPAAPDATIPFYVISSCEIFAPSSGTTAPNAFSSRVGAVDWPLNSCLIDDGADKMASLGDHVVRILLSANCNQSLVDALHTPEMQEALDNPNLATILLTVFDRSTCVDTTVNPKIYVDPTLYPNSTVVADYQGLTQELYRLYHDRGKTFIIDNWEGDNAVYCGRAYAYATDTATRAACDANYPVLYRGVPNPQTGMTGFTDWLQARQQGIAAGKSWALSQGLLGGVQVSYAVQFNIIHALQDAGLESVLADALPSVAHDYASYSAYESTNLGVAKFEMDLNYLRDTWGIATSSLVIGEFGYSEQGPNGQQGSDLQQQVRQKSDAILNKAIELGVPYIFQWVVFDNADLGVYDFAGQGQALACYYESRLTGGSYPTATCN
jgi:hypothetical protein